MLAKINTIFAPSSSEVDEDVDGGVIIDSVDGDILVCYITDGLGIENKPFRVQNVLSFQAAVTNSTYWPQNATVGYVVVNFQTFSKESYIDRLVQVLHKHPNIVALFGFINPVYALHSASFVSAIKLPSFTVASSIQVDDLLRVRNHEFMTRITSKRSKQLTGTIPSILSGLGINIVSIFYERAKEAEFTKLIQVLDLGDNKVDVEYHLLLNGTADSSHVSSFILDESHFEEDSVKEQSRLHTIILLLQGKNIEKLFNDLAQVKGISDVIFITDSSGCRSLQALAEGNFSFRLCQTEYSEPEIMTYMANYRLYERQNGENELSVSSKVLAHWYEQHVGVPCIVGKDEGCKSVLEVSSLEEKFSRYNHRIYYAARKVIKSLENISNEEVERIKGRTFDDVMINTSSVGNMILSKFLENNVLLPEDTTFLRYTDGEMEDDFEVIFNNFKSYSRINRTVWTSGESNSKFDTFMINAKSQIAELSDGKQFVCSQPCSAGNKTVLDRRFLNCWTCVPCQGNRYTQYGNWSSCEECDSQNTFLWVNEKKTACDKPAGSLNFSTISGKVVWIVASINILVLIFTVAVYIKNWKSRVIISSGRDLSCVMFCGILLGHIESILIATEPSSNLCIYVQIFSHFIIMLTVCPLLVKTFRIWMVFKYSIKLGRRLRNYVNDWVTLSECLVLMLPLLALLSAGLFLDDSKRYRFSVNYEEESLEGPVIVTKSCGPLNFTLMFIGIVYAAVLLLVSSILGWGCRKLPDNFKESMHIFLSSLISLLLIAVYVPAMLTMAGFTQVSLLAGVITIICLTLNLVIFLPKVYVVLFIPPVRQKAMFKSGRSDRKSVVSETVIHDVSE
ncbi:hypothetical protein ACHWQZ_G009751 [Mnemiopsis leidyi]